MILADDDSELALYVHWPFCKSKCPYCDFNSHVRGAVDDRRWRAALLAELDHYAALIPGRRLVSIFFGGGTPSLMQAETVAAVLERAARHWQAPPDLEVTLEANPTSVEAARLAEFRDAGVNRVSLGVQALDDAALRFLGRGHDAGEARAAIAAAAQAVPHYSFDLIYARPGQSVASWERELDAALALAGDHLSLYQLTIEHGTAFAGAYARGDFALPDDDLAGALFETTQARLEAAGLAAYEISNHARPGAACRHNLIYWRYQDYVGIGPGAHGRFSDGGAKRATRRHSGPEAWLEAVERDGHGTAESAVVTGRDLVEEALMMGLRLSEGIDRAVFAANTGADPVAALGEAALAP